MKALVLGGTGFMGRRLVDYLIRENWDVTVASSGHSPNPFGDAVDFVVVDRFKTSSFEEKLLSPPYFDVLFDQLCFGPDDAEKITEVFKGRIGRYVFVSSGSVYSGVNKETRTEEDFDPFKHKIQKGGLGNLGYDEGKRSAEAYMFQNAEFPVAAARFPIVIGHDDSTKRFQKLVMDVISGNEISIPKKSGKRRYLWVDDAGRFLFWLGKNGKEGPYNACSGYGIDVLELVKKISEITGSALNVRESPDGESSTSYYSEQDSLQVPDKAVREGFEFTNFDEWLKKEVEQVAAGKDQSPNTLEYFGRKFSGT